MKTIKTIDELKEVISTKYNYVIGFYDKMTDVYINFDVYKSPIDCIRQLSKYLEVVKLPLSDVELHLLGRIEDTGLVSNVPEPFVLDPVIYYKDIYNKDKKTEEKK